VASVGLVALGACGSEQGAAMFVGDERVTEATLDGYVDGEVASYLEQGATLEDVSYGDSRQNAAAVVLYAELGHALDLEAPDTNNASSEFEALYMEAVKYRDELAATAEAREMTEDEAEALHAAVSEDQNLVQRIVSEWVAAADLSEDELGQFYAAAGADPNVVGEVVRMWGEQQAGFADDLNQYIAEYDVSLNPRYGTLDISPLVGVFKVEVPQR
jgi:hypothetical protein